MTREQAKGICEMIENHGIEVIKAYGEGKIIQHLNLDGEWVDCDMPISFSNNHSFRIKPEEEQMAKTELKDQLKSYEGYINDIPLVIDPCKQCKVYKNHNGYDIGDRLVKGVWKKGYCDDCCWFYNSKFEVGV